MDDATFEMVMRMARIAGLLAIPFCFGWAILLVTIAWKSYYKLQDIENHLRILTFHRPDRPEKPDGQGRPPV